MMKMRTGGAKELAALLRYVAEVVPDRSRKVMHRGADKIVEEAKLNAPVDKHNLEESIRKEVSYEDSGRLKIDITAGGFVNGVNVDDYAVEVHEHYREDKPGKGTQAKRDALPGRHVGGQFLERAVEGIEPKLNAAVIQAVIVAEKGR